MILAALNDYYERKIRADAGALPPFGFERVRIPFLIVLGEGGEFLGFGEVDKEYVAPRMVDRTRNKAANLLWDKPEYALGAPDGADARKIFVAAVKDRLPRASGEKAGARGDAGVRAVLRFLENPDLAAALAAAARARPKLWKKMIDEKSYLTFALLGEAGAVFESSAVREEIEESAAARADGEKIFCPLRGEFDNIARLHPQFSVGRERANFVSFNEDAFCSYGKLLKKKKQHENAPIGERAAFGYATALRHLLRSDSRQKAKIGDVEVVFWAKEKGDDFAEDVGALIESNRNDPDDGRSRIVKRIVERARTGGREDGDGGGFFVLGLEANRSRVMARFWRESTTAEIAANIKRHFDDIALDSGERFAPCPGGARLLESLLPPKGKKAIPPRFVADFADAIVAGRDYPRPLFFRALARCRVVARGKNDKDRGAAEERAHYCVALLKGCLIRNFHKEASSMLDKNQTDVGYRLGRLFAALERLQETASGRELNATIRDSYYPTASTMPARVFGRLMNGRIAHLAKLRKGGKRRDLFFAALIDDIADGVGGKDGFHSRLTPAEQGMFHLGYCHQRRALKFGGDSAQTHPQENDDE